MASADDFEKVREDDPDIKQMVDTVQLLEGSLQDCAVNGPQKLLDTFTACQLTPDILNRWNSPVLDGLWQAVTGRTPDGTTPFALNPPINAAELLDRLVWPKAYPEAVDLLLDVMNIARGPTNLLVSAIISAASTGREEILKRLLSNAQDDISLRDIGEGLVQIAQGGSLSCCDLVFARITPFGSSCPMDCAVAEAFVNRAASGHLKLIEYLLSRYSFDTFVLESAIIRACRCTLADEAEQTVLLMLKHLQTLTPRFIAETLVTAACINLVQVVKEMLDRPLSDEDCVAAAVSAIGGPDGSESLQLLHARFNAVRRAALLARCVRTAVRDGKVSTCTLLLDGVREVPRDQIQNGLNKGLAQCVASVRIELVRLFLQHGARARAGDDYIIYLAALSGRADVMELLLGAADVDAECAGRYRQQMSEPAGLLGVAQTLLETSMLLWGDSDAQLTFSDEKVDSLSAALYGRNVAALQWLLTPPTRCQLDHADPLLAAVHAGDYDLIQLLLHPRSIKQLRRVSTFWYGDIRRSLQAARAAQNFDLITLLFDESLPARRLSFKDVTDAIWSKDPFIRRYMFENTALPVLVPMRDLFAADRSVLLTACMTGDCLLLEDVWRLVLHYYQGVPEVMEAVSQRISAALKLCVEGDLTPVAMALLHSSHELTLTDRYFDDDAHHPLVLAAMYGNMPCVKLWLAKGACPRLALPLAAKHQQHEVVAYLRQHAFEASL